MAEELFSGDRLQTHLALRERECLEEIADLSEAELLGTSPGELVEHFVSKFREETPAISESGITSDFEEVRIDVTDHPLYGTPRGRSRNYADGIRYVMRVPCEGNTFLLRLRPSSYELSSVHADIHPDCLVLSYDLLPYDADELPARQERDLSKLKRYLAWVAKDIAGFNDRIRGSSTHAVESRLERLRVAREAVQKSGYPVQRRSDAPRTYAAPTVRRRITPRSAPIPSQQQIAEPTLTDQDYEHILSTIGNMAMVMERNPSSFRDIREEDLRNHLLVQLNGHFEGQATGETFNCNGKTDILVRHEGNNIFIAECKFWHGPKRFVNAIDQLLGYSTWRDTKTALVVFNRQTKMSTVLDRVQRAVQQHPSYRNTLEYGFETGFRYLLARDDDPERYLIMTVLVLDVPGNA